MDRLKILNEDFFDDNVIDDTEEIEDIEVDNTEYTHYFHIYFNTPIMCGMHYEKYVEQYTPRITDAIKITKRIFSTFSAIGDYSSIELSKDRLGMCDKEVEMGEYNIRYSSEIHNGKYVHGLAFKPDGVIINIKAVCNFRTLSQIEKFFDLFFNKVGNVNRLLGVDSFIIENLKMKDAKYDFKEYISIFNGADWNREEWKQKRDDIAQMLDVLAKPGIYGQFLHKYNSNDAELIIKSKRMSDTQLFKTDIVYSNPVRVQNVVFYETGRATEVVSCEYDFDSKKVIDYYTPFMDIHLSDKELDDMCTKAVHQVTSRKSVFDMYILKFDAYTFDGKDHVGVHFIFHDTFSYKDKEYIVMFYSELIDYSDITGGAYCLNMMKSVGYSEENALNHKNIGVFYRDEIRYEIIDKAKELRLTK